MVLNRQVLDRMGPGRAMTDTSELEAVAVHACEAAGRSISEQFRRGRLVGDYTTDDVKTDADRAAEDRMLETIRSAFPEHAIRTEESGSYPGEEYTWVLDPLDGTNNVAAGLPLFATAAAVRREGRTRLAVVHEPLPDDTYVAVHGEGAAVNGHPVAADSDLPLAHATVSFVTGFAAIRDADRSARASAIRSALVGRCKRVIQTWAPCVDWGLLARGSVEGIVTFHPDEWEHHAGSMLAREAGAAVREDGPLAVHAADPDMATQLLSTAMAVE